MHLLASFCNLRVPALPALGLFDVAQRELHVLRLPGGLPWFLGFNGLATCDRYLYVAAQSPLGGSILIFDRGDFTLASHYECRAAADLHSILWVDGKLYVVSTGSDELIELQLDGSTVTAEQIIWRPDTHAPRRDAHHLNSLALWRGELLVAGFGRKAPPAVGSTQEAAWSTACNGFIYSLTRGENLIEGLEHPHSLTTVGDRLLYCESQRAVLRELGSNWELKLPGYSRGVCAVGETIFAATSVGRQFSRSSGRINNPAHLDVEAGSCTINRLSADGKAIAGTIDVGGCGREIYELLPISGADSWPRVPESEWRDLAMRELVSAMHERMLWAMQSMNQVESMQEELAFSQSRATAATAYAERLDGENARLAADVERLKTEAEQLRLENQRLSADHAQRETSVYTRGRGLGTGVQTW